MRPALLPLLVTVSLCASTASLAETRRHVVISTFGAPIAESFKREGSRAPIRRVSLVMKEGRTYFPAELYDAIGVHRFIDPPQIEQATEGGTE